MAPTRKKKTGRPSKFTPENRGRLVELISAGLTISHAARQIGIRANTVNAWLTRGRREGKGPYSDFAGAVDEARRNALPEPLTEDEHRRLVSREARKGSVQAQKLYWEMICADRSANEEPEAPADPLQTIDELAQRRTA